MQKKWKAILLGLVLLLVLAQGVFAMALPGYRVDWTNLLSGGGGSSQSSAYRVDITVGQTAIDASANPQYRVQMGYWGGIAPELKIRVPNVRK